MKPGIGSLKRDTDRLGDLAHRQLFDLVKNEDFSLFWREGVEQLTELVPQTASPEGAFLFRCARTIRHFVVQNFSPSARFGAVVGGGPNTDTVDPRPQRRAVLEGVELAPDDEKNLVGHVFEVAGVHTKVPEGSPHITNLLPIDPREFSRRAPGCQPSRRFAEYVGHGALF